jgi:SAM-dependent methyltransferase
MGNNMQCEICQSKLLSIWATVSDYNYYRCKRCRYLFVYPKPSSGELKKYYQNAHFYDKAESEEPRLVRESESRLRMLSRFAEEYGLKKSLLDVGSASGIFLEQGRKNGWSVEGIELSPELVKKAKNKGFRVTEGLIEELPGNSKFPLVTAWEVIEHCIDPIEFLMKLREHTQDGGLIALSTPLSNGLPALLLGSQFPMICPPEHISLFSRKSVTMLGERLRLKMVHFRSFSNLKKVNVERGLFRFVFGPILIPETLGKKLSTLLATAISPLPDLIDMLGMGCEMEIVFRRMR